MTSKKVVAKLNDQIGLEQAASQSYLGMAIWCENTSLGGAAAFFYAQSDEERGHMMKIVRYVNGCGGAVSVTSVDAPSVKFASLKAVVSAGLDSEKKVTASIQKITTLALEEKDYESFNYLQWFVDEQAEEEQKFQSILDKFELLGEDGRALYSIDKLMGRMAVEE